MKVLIGLLALFLSLQQVLAQAAPDWHHADPEADGIYGVSTLQAYRLLQHKPARKVVVAIIDSGVDIDHEDLKDNIWTNSGEVPDNGKDDDQNGYVDDVHGWNFLGNTKGENIYFETLELTRLYKGYAERFVGVEDIDITEAEEVDHAFYLDLKKAYEKTLAETQSEWEGLEGFYKNYQSAKIILKNHLNKDNFSIADVRNIKADDEILAMAQDFYLEIDASGLDEEAFEEIVVQTSNALNYHLNPRFNPRSEIIGDNPEVLQDGPYGNPDVGDDKTQHGTHVAGIIAAQRDNGLGIDGIADHVELMILRAIPDGDERDKDVALAIRYAVDNGADIINLSFGKSYSPQKKWVDESVRFAEKEGVLIIHGSGNDAYDLDKVAQYPTDYLTGFSAPADNWITVGATGPTADLDFVGSFSNYGKEKVDLYAPGVDIYSTLPDNAYRRLSGTSMACPVVTGVAALIWTYYPELSALDLREILLQSVISSKKWKVYRPSLEEDKSARKTRFSKLSSTGGVINAYQAVKLAEEWKSENTD